MRLCVDLRLALRFDVFAFHGAPDQRSEYVILPAIRETTPEGVHPEPEELTYLALGRAALVEGQVGLWRLAMHCDSLSKAHHRCLQLHGLICVCSRYLVRQFRQDCGYQSASGCFASAQSSQMDL